MTYRTVEEIQASINAYPELVRSTIVERDRADDLSRKLNYELTRGLPEYLKELEDELEEAKKYVAVMPLNFPRVRVVDTRYMAGDVRLKEGMKVLVAADGSSEVITTELKSEARYGVMNDMGRHHGTYTYHVLCFDVDTKLGIPMTTELTSKYGVKPA